MILGYHDKLNLSRSGTRPDIEKDQAGQAKQDPDRLKTGDFLLIKQRPDEYQDDRERDIRHQGSHADLPAGPISHDVAEFQPDQAESERDAAPVDLPELNEDPVLPPPTTPRTWTPVARADTR